MLYTRKSRQSMMCCNVCYTVLFAVNEQKVYLYIEMFLPFFPEHKTRRCSLETEENINS